MNIFEEFENNSPQLYAETFNGFTGYGETPRQAQIACAYAAVSLPLDSSHPGIQYFDELPVCWQLDPEGYFKAMNDR